MRKRGIVSEYLPWILIAIAVLVILVITSYFLKDTAVVLVDKLKNIFVGR